MCWVVNFLIPAGHPYLNVNECISLHFKIDYVHVWPRKLLLLLYKLKKNYVLLLEEEKNKRRERNRRGSKEEKVEERGRRKWEGRVETPPTHF